MAMTMGTAGVLAMQSLQEFLTERALRKSEQHTARFLAKAVALTSAIAVFLFAGLLSAFTAIGWLVRTRAGFDVIVCVLALALSVLLLHSPFEAVCHTLSRPDVIVGAKAAGFIVATSFAFLWGAKDGAVGIGTALLMATFVSLV